jgi:hypothetical protein
MHLYTCIKYAFCENFSDQLELKQVQQKKHHFFFRKNRTAPAPLGTADSLDEIDLNGIRKDNKEQQKGTPDFLRKEAFIEENSMPQGSPISTKKKQSVTDKSNLFCIHCGDVSSLNLENSDSHLEKCMSSHETDLVNGKNGKTPDISEVKLTDSKVQPLHTKGRLSNSFVEENFLPPIESDKATVIKQISSSSFPSQGKEGLQNEPDQVSAVPIKQLSTGKRSMAIENSKMTSHQLGGAEKCVPKQQSCNVSMSRGTRRSKSAPQGKTRLENQSLADETSSSGTRSHMGSQHLSDSGFVSPKNVLPPVLLASCVDKPSWILPPLPSQRKHSSLGEIHGGNLC